jgi:hypothetical protein
MMMSYDELGLYINNWKKDEIEHDKQLTRLVIWYIMASSGNYKDLPSLKSIIKCEIDKSGGPKKKLENTDILKEQLKAQYAKLWQSE